LFDPIATFQLITHLKKTILPAIPLLAMNTLVMTLFPPYFMTNSYATKIVGRFAPIASEA